MPFLLFVPVLMYFGWRAWLGLRGEPYEPRGHQTSRLDAMHEYMRAHPPPRRSRTQRWSTAAMMVLVYALMSWFAWTATEIAHDIIVAWFIGLAALSLWMATWQWDR